MHTILGNSTPHATHEYGANQAGSFSISMKPPLSFEEQLDLMIGRGLIVNDRLLATRGLAESNYYRLRGYWLTYESGNRFKPGVTFEQIWDTYELDADLRNLMWNAIAPIRRPFERIRAAPGRIPSADGVSRKLEIDAVECQIASTEYYAATPLSSPGAPTARHRGCTPASRRAGSRAPGRWPRASRSARR